MFLPLKDDNPNSETPVVTWALIAFCIVIFIWQKGLSGSEYQIAILSYGIIPAHLFGSSEFVAINPLITPDNV